MMGLILIVGLVSGFAIGWALGHKYGVQHEMNNSLSRRIDGESDDNLSRIIAMAIADSKTSEI